MSYTIAHLFTLILLLLRSPAISLWFIIWVRLLRVWPFFNATTEVITFRLGWFFSPMSRQCIFRISDSLIGILQARKTMEHRRVWLASPMREWQSLWQRTQTKSDTGLSARAAAFLLILFSLCCWASVSSKLERHFCTVCLQADRLRAVASQLFWSMFKAFRSLLHTSLNRNCGLPVGLFPCMSSP